MPETPNEQGCVRAPEYHVQKKGLVFLIACVISTLHKGLVRTSHKQEGSGVMQASISTTAMAGTLESSDAQVTVEPHSAGIELSIESSVMNQYGRAIESCTRETLERLGIQNAKVTVVDRGALDCTLQARIETAVLRSEGAAESNVDWGGCIR